MARKLSQSERTTSAEMNTDTKISPLVRKQAQLESELRKVRQDSLIAARRSDYRKVAQLTTQAARLNQELTHTKIQVEIVY
jgi:hypothetical protein